MRNPFLPLSAWVYGKLKPKFSGKNKQEIQKILLQLHPAGNVEKMYDGWQINKLAWMFTILFIGVVSAIFFHLSSRIGGRLEDGTQLVRNEWGVGDYQITLHARTEEWDREIPFLVKERELTQNEREDLQKELYTLLPELIKNENADLNHVTGDLNLITSIQGYPFRFTWSSSDSERISTKGKVDRSDVDSGGEEVDLTVVLSDGQERVSFTYKVVLLPEILNEEESFFRLLEKTLLTTDSEARSQKQMILPDSLKGKSILWGEVKQDSSILIFLLFCLGSLAAGKEMENNLEKNIKKRKRQLIKDYSGFVSKLRLYLSAGLSAQNAFLRMTADYGNRLEPNKQKNLQDFIQHLFQKQSQNYLYEEMKISCYQLENGVMEEQVYQDFGRRCGEMSYRRLSYLLAVHLKQGNSQLLTLLAREADDSQEDRKKEARKAGEEASTKLLLPMILMLIVVMLLVLLPAYMDFGSI